MVDSIKAAIKKILDKYEFVYAASIIPEQHLLDTVIPPHLHLSAFSFIGQEKPNNPADDWEDDFGYPWSINVRFRSERLTLGFRSGIRRIWDLSYPDLDGDEDKIVGFLIIVSDTLVDYVRCTRVLTPPRL